MQGHFLYLLVEQDQKKDGIKLPHVSQNAVFYMSAIFQANINKLSTKIHIRYVSS